MSCAQVPTRPLPATGQEAGIDLGLESFATLSDGTRILTPGCSRKAERYLAKCYLAKCYLAKCYLAKCYLAKCYLAKCYLAKCYLAKCPRRIARRKKQEGQPAQAQGSLCPGKSLSDGTPGTPPASGLPSQDSASTDPELILN